MIIWSVSVEKTALVGVGKRVDQPQRTRGSAKRASWGLVAAMVTWVGLNAALAASIAPAESDGVALNQHQPMLLPNRLSATNVAQLDDLQRRTFDYFWVSANPRNGLAPDNYPHPKSSSIAAIGFALSSYVVGVQRHYITRQQALHKSLQVLDTLLSLPECDRAVGCARFHGFYYHFLDMATGLRYRDSELSSIDTTLLLGGVLSTREYFDQDTPAERRLRRLADQLYAQVDWPFMVHDDGTVAMGWSPEKGLFKASWTGYNEAMLLIILGLGSPTHPLAANAWDVWASTYPKFWHTEYGEHYLSYPALFVHQYSHIWIDFREIRDDYMAAENMDYFENSRRAVYAQFRYAQHNPFGYRDYGQPLWGVTASDGPDVPRTPTDATFFLGYAGRGMGGMAHRDDGTIAPTGAIASMPFAPELVLPSLGQFESAYPELYQAYGFLDAINPSVPKNAVVRKGHLTPQHGWIDDQYLGIDQGPILLMTENYRTQLIWNLMQKNQSIITGLTRAGFRGGWLAGP